MTSPYRDAALPESTPFFWRRLAACNVFTIVAAVVAALHFLGFAAIAGGEWNDSWRIGTDIGIASGGGLLALLVIPAIIFALWVERDRQWMHPQLLRSVVRSWRVALAFTALSLAILTVVAMHTPPPSSSGGGFFLWAGC